VHHRLRPVTSFPALQDHPSVTNCTVEYFNQRIDHFRPTVSQNDNAEPSHFKQRYFVCQQNEWKPGAPVFFYVGNEADVTLYVNATGLMWESAPEFGALLVFAEHRYFGKSVLFGSAWAQSQHLEYLSTEQVLADYASLIVELRTTLTAQKSAFIAFGGSYGGMLASWLRIKYPFSVEGAIAGSAPIMSFLGENPAYDTGSYAKIVTEDASAAGGASDSCSNNIREAWPKLFKMGETSDGRAKLADLFRLCPNSGLNSTADVYALAYWLQSSMDYMAMGSYPYASSYILNGHGLLPPYPLREMCKPVGQADPTDTDALLQALREGVGVFYNYSKQETCFNIHGSANNATTMDGQLWDYLYCSEMTQPMSRDGVQDMFFSQSFDLAQTEHGCASQWGIVGQPNWATTLYGGWRIESASNIVWSNGGLDPWRGGGVTRNISETNDLVALIIDGVGHHMDLMFSHEGDPPSVIKARATERQYIAKWTQAHKTNY